MDTYQRNPLGHLKEASGSADQPPEHLLWLAMRAGDAKGRMSYARAGLTRAEQELEPDTEVLLLRQLYLGHLELHELRSAADVALQMVEVGPLRDVAYHDAARALFALGDPGAAIEAQRLAARHAPAERRSFQLWNLATLQHFGGEGEAAEATLERAERWATRDRPLLRAHRAWIRLDGGRATRGLEQIVETLRRSKCREGYGQLVLGMIAHASGDSRRAVVHLRAFLTRNASADPVKALALREELRRARLALAEHESV